MKKTWVLTAESSRARIFSVVNRISPLREIADLVHLESRVHGQELNTDRAGRSADGSGQGGHALGSQVDVKQHEATVFAKRVSDCLERGRANSEYEDLILMAAPGFLGLLRQNLSDNTLKMVSKTINKNLVHSDEGSIRNHIYK